MVKFELFIKRTRETMLSRKSVEFNNKQRKHNNNINNSTAAILEHSNTVRSAHLFSIRDLSNKNLPLFQIHFASAEFVPKRTTLLQKMRLFSTPNPNTILRPKAVRSSNKYAIVQSMLDSANGHTQWPFYNATAPMQNYSMTRSIRPICNKYPIKPM